MTEFRLAQPHETPAVLRFYEDMIDAMRDWEEKPGWQKGIYPTADYLRASAEQGELFLLTEGDAILGALVLNRRWNESYDTVSWQIPAGRDEVMVIHTLGIAPACHRRGLGKMMMEGCALAAKEAGCRALRLDVLYNNRPALEFYPRAGFAYVETVKAWYPDTDWAEFLMFERAL